VLHISQFPTQALLLAVHDQSKVVWLQVPVPTQLPEQTLLAGQFKVSWQSVNPSQSLSKSSLHMPTSLEDLALVQLVVFQEPLALQVTTKLEFMQTP